MPLVQTRGAASAQGFGEFAQAATAVNYIEDVFSTYVYQGNASGQTITNGIDLTKGGLIWSKCRTLAYDHVLVTTTNGLSNYLVSNTTAALAINVQGVTSVSATGYAVGTGAQWGGDAAEKFVGWTFRKQPKFFDVVTYTGTGSNTTIAHSLGSAPGCMLVKCTSTGGSWQVYHRSLTSAAYQLELNNTGAEFSDPTIWNSTAPTSTVFSVGTNLGINGSGRIYVAYLFAHDAGGFGLTGTDNVISCGSATTNGSGLATVTLGYEPQWVLYKNVAGGSWILIDNMRGWAVDASGADNMQYLRAETSAVEGPSAGLNPTATGFNFTAGSTPSSTYIYIAIRRGPMKVPTVGTSVFSPIARTGTGAAVTVTGAGFAPDLVIAAERGATQSGAKGWYDRLRNPQNRVTSTSTAAETATYADSITALTMNGMTIGADSNNQVNYLSATYINWFFGRAPSFFDEVCYTGTGAATTFSHNLQAVPELYIVKGRSGATAWQVYSSALANTEYVVLNTTAAKATGATRWNSTTPTSSVFSIGTASEVNTSAATYVAYLFATCAGVSKVGSYTGTGTTLQINCGFTAGARFVLIKRTDSTGDWYVWDSARGIIAGNDPYLLLNSTAAEVTSTDYVDTYSAGFEISSTAPAAINASAGTYIFLAIA